MTSFVVDFESEGPKSSEPSKDKFDYGQVLEAVVHNQLVAENVLARCCKRHFRDLLGDKVKLCLPEEMPLGVQVWSASVTAAIAGVSIPENWSDTLRTLTSIAASNILGSRPDGSTVVLIGSLTTRLLEVGSHLYSVTLKQQWYFND